MATSLTAVIPIAGKGTRLAPATRIVPKALFPLPCADGAVRPVADVIAREALAAGCGRIVFVCGPGQDGPLREYFSGERELAGRIEYVTDVEPFGFGYAVWAARRAAAGGPVLVMLGDHIHLPAPGKPAPAAQAAEAFAARQPAALVGVQVVEERDLKLFGVCRGEWEPGTGNREPENEKNPSRCEALGPDPGSRFPVPSSRLYHCTDIIEKPDAATAARRLATAGLPSGRYLAHAGIYALSDEIFDCLDELVRRRQSPNEVGLTEAQQELLRRHPRDYLLCLLEGSTHDMGTAEGFAATVAAVWTAKT